ncbi:MAG: PhzF family phenazine biosynthesis protein [Alphaproteobacteria bacterium]
MELNFHTLDVFTTDRFGGNPLAAVLGSDDLSTEQMQVIAREFNLAETIFVRKPKDPANTASVRIFFPTDEISFAGHPTIGCAILLAEKLKGVDEPFETEILLEEVAGLVSVKVRKDRGATWAQFTAPIVPYSVPRVLPSVHEVAIALDLALSDLCPNGMPLGLHEGGPRFLYLPITSREALARARPQEPQWSNILNALGAVGGYLYARGGQTPSTDFATRMFNPSGEGIEDPATGSAAALFASQLHKVTSLKDGTHIFRLEQGYEMGRPSDIQMEADVTGGKLVAVRVAGSAVRVMEGQLSL